MVDNRFGVMSCRWLHSLQSVPLLTAMMPMARCPLLIIEGLDRRTSTYTHRRNRRKNNSFAIPSSFLPRPFPLFPLALASQPTNKTPKHKPKTNHKPQQTKTNNKPQNQPQTTTSKSTTNHTNPNTNQKPTNQPTNNKPQTTTEGAALGTGVCCCAVVYFWTGGWSCAGLCCWCVCFWPCPLGRRRRRRLRWLQCEAQKA